MSEDFYVKVPKGWVPLILRPEVVHALANDELPEEAVTAARFAERVSRLPSIVGATPAETQVNTVHWVAAKVREAVEKKA